VQVEGIDLPRDGQQEVTLHGGQRSGLPGQKHGDERPRHGERVLDGSLVSERAERVRVVLLAVLHIPLIIYYAHGRMPDQSSPSRGGQDPPGGDEQVAGPAPLPHGARVEHL
jgi:hypothetical protein